MLPLQNTPLTALSRNLKILEISEEEELLSVMHYFSPPSTNPPTTTLFSTP